LSYTSLVKGSSPLGYWKLNGSGSAVAGSSAVIYDGNFTQPPLVVNSEKALIVKPEGASVSILNEFNLFYQNYENKTYSLEFWFSFNGLFDGSGYTKNLSASSSYFIDGKLDIVKFVNDDREIGKIYYDYISNTFRFIIYGNNSEAYLPVRNLNNSFYIVASYSNRTLNLWINGEFASGGYVNDTELFTNNANSSSILINGTSLNPSASMNFVISDLAIYDYPLNQTHQRNRVFYALSSDSPVSNTKLIETSYFDLSEKDYQARYFQKIQGQAFGNAIVNSNNLSVDSVMGLGYNHIANFDMSNLTTSGSATITASGLQFLAENTALDFFDYGKFFSGEKHKTITLQATTLGPEETILFSIPNSINNNNSLVVTVASSGFYLKQYVAENSTLQELKAIEIPVTPSVQFNFGMSIDQNIFYIYANGKTDSISIDSFNLLTNSVISIGNRYTTDVTTYYPFNIFIKNFGMHNLYETIFDSYNFEDNKMFMARFNKNYSVSQISTWVRQIPLSTLDGLVGSKVTWDSMDNCLVETSPDGENWETIKRGQSIPSIDYTGMNLDKLLRVKVPFEYEIESNNQTFSNLEIMLYKDLSIYSNDKNYELVPMKEDNGYESYVIKRVPQSILFRQNNIGISFDKYNNVVNGYAKIINNHYGYNPNGIDFWFRLNSLQFNVETDSASTGNGLFDAAADFQFYADVYDDEYLDTYGMVLGTKVYNVYISAIDSTINFSPELQVYINGSSAINGVDVIEVGEFYHIAIIIDTASVTQNNNLTLYLNGYGSETSPLTIKNNEIKYHSHATYGHVNIWNRTLTPTMIQDRYNTFISTNYSTVEDSMELSTWQPDWNSSSIISFSTYNIG